MLLGPVTYLKLGKSKDVNFDPLSLLSGLLPVYIDLLKRLAAEGAAWVQLDEPCLVLDLDDATRKALRATYEQLASALPKLKIMLTTYFGGLGDNLDTALSLPVAGLHLDLVRAPEQLDTVVVKARQDLVLSLGVIDGRNIWRANLPALLDRLESVVAKRGIDHVQIAPSCSLLHVPIDVALEADLDAELKSWLAFSVQKMAELATLGEALARGRASVADAVDASAKAAAARNMSSKVHDAKVSARIAAVTSDMARRKRVFADRAKLQRERFGLPSFPTTTIGSFPQTAEVRKARSAHAKGRIERRRLRDIPAGRDGTNHPLAGRHRPRRARAWRVRAQRHGAVFRRAAVRIRFHQAWLGAELRLALRSSADHVRRRVPAQADDGRLVEICAVPDVEADEGHAHRSRHHSQLVVRAR